MPRNERCKALHGLEVVDLRRLRADLSNGVLSFKTSILQPGKTYSLQGSSSASGPFQDIQSEISVAKPSYEAISVASGGYAFYRLVSISDTPAKVTSQSQVRRFLESLSASLRPMVRVLL